VVKVIDQAMQITVDRLNGHLAGKFRMSEDFAALSPLTDGEGKPADIVRNRLAVFIVNLAHDAMPRGGALGVPRSAGLAAQENRRPINLDIYFMLAASYDPDTYGEGLKLLSAGMTYFQANPVITPDNTPNLPKGILQLSYEISNLRVEEVGQLWGNLGGRYVPAVLLKMRSVTVDAQAVSRIAPTIRDTKPASALPLENEAPAS